MNNSQRRGPIPRFFGRLWDAMNFTRRLVFNLLFFGLLLLILVGLAAGNRSKALLERTTLVVAPEGAVVEQYSCDPVSRGLAQMTNDINCEEVQLRDLLLALEAAREDKRIERVLLRTDRLRFSGYAALRELTQAIASVRAAGKQVVAFGEFFSQEQYLLAAQANEVYLDPMGGVLLEGMGRYRPYFREGLQDKLGVDVHLFKVGEYKSAAEPVVLDAASADAKQADLYWMNDIWQRHLGDIARVRKIATTQLANDIEQLPADLVAARGDLARYAQSKRLVDGLKTQEEVETLLTQRGVADEDSDTGFRAIDLAGYLGYIGRSAAAMDERPQIAVVVAEGAIVSGEQPPGTIGGQSTAALLREARDDEKVKTVVLRVNSPGGEVFASEQIRREVVKLREAGKPVVVSMGDLAASGGYWISMNADRIYADPSTITGSIGIFTLFATVPRALEKIGVRTDGVGTTRLAGAFDPTRALQPEAGQVIQAVIDKGYRDFTGRVAQARKRSVSQIDAVARGRVWTGAQARECGLVDAVGGLHAAINDAAQRAKLGKPDAYRVRYVEDSSTPFERFFSRFASSRIGARWLRESPLLHGLLGNATPQAARELMFLQSAIAAPGLPVKPLAHCFCGW